MQLQGKTVIVTGGGRGIGREICRTFAAKGAHVAVLDMNQADLDQTVSDCEAAGVKARSYVVNVTKEDQVIAAMDAIVGDFGRIEEASLPILDRICDTPVRPNNFGEPSVPTRDVWLWAAIVEPVAR